ncbi:MAG: adenosylcobinamide-GDP ribazoletransferase [Eubacterium sp.]|nr:adenosylcobinamide-GDP ribazoletransferase [Eubacterium sp.]
MKGFFIAISIYSHIPVPQFKWKDEDMRYSLCFFPFVGVIIGALMSCWILLSEELGLGKILITSVAAALPLIVTGGFHVDGFMDTMDAFHSYKSKEEKIKIMSDPHIGAFSVIMTIMYYLLFLGVISEVDNVKLMLSASGGFVISRIFSAGLVILLKPAKENGMLKYFNDTAARRRVLLCLALELIILNVVLTITVNPIMLIETAVALLFSIFYKYKCEKELGGVTGDTAGYFVTVVELLIICVPVIYKYVV